MDTQERIDTLLARQRLYARFRDHQFSLYEDYARKQGLQSKSLLILLWLYHSPCGITQEAIVRHTYSTKQVVHATIAMFAGKGYVTKTTSSQDKRKKLIALTETGRAFAAAVINPMDEAEGRALATLPEEQQHVLLQLSRALTQALTTEFAALTQQGGTVHD